ncbi:MAG: SDR family oxidoreductase [Anaerolineaceae bacterium]|nr:SDR family oxidoreductase [Anaerolineaceae bacterium]
MTILVVGATGATGRLLVQQLLNRNQTVKAVVRTPEKLPQAIRNHKKLQVIQAAILDLRDEEMVQLVGGCTAVASCLGHNLNLKGIYGAPRLLVTETARRLCRAIKTNQPPQPVRYVLMNTAGNRNRDIPEQVSFQEKGVVGLLRLLLPPQRDNEKAADYLRQEIGQNDQAIQWAAVRPDSLIDEAAVSPYETHASPIRSAIFDPGKTSRINVAHFMAELITEDALWQKWQGQMPVLYNTAVPPAHKALAGSQGEGHR